MAKQATRRARQGSPLVYQLIERMSGDEKRYFKLFAQKYDKGDNNLCLCLFNAVNEQLRKGNAISDQTIQQQIKGHSLQDYFASAKNKLKNMLCDALYEMHSKHMEEFTIMKNIGIAGILHDKGFMEEGNKQLKQAMEVARQKEYYTLWLEGFRHRVNYSVTGLTTDFKLLHSWNDEMQEVMTTLTDYSQQVFYNRLTFNAYVAAPDKIDARTTKVFNEKSLLENTRKAKSAYAKYLSLNGLIFYYEKNKQRKQINHIALQQKNVLFETLAYTNRYTGEFFVSYQNYLNSLDPRTEPDLIIEGSREMEKLAQQYLVKGKNKKVGTLAVFSATTIRLNVFIEQNNLAALKTEVVHAIRVHKQTSTILGNVHEVVLSSLIKDSFFGLSKYAEALKWIKHIKAVAPAGVMNHYKFCNLLTELMILIDSGASIRSLRNSEENLRLSISRFNFTEPQQQTLLHLLKLVSTVTTARNGKETGIYLNNILAFTQTIRKSADGTLRNIVAESNLALWATRKLK